jgi:uncharacterized lipoprotein YajG
MKTLVFVVAFLLLAGCASKPPRCDRRLTPINASYGAGTHARAGGL